MVAEDTGYHAVGFGLRDGFRAVRVRCLDACPQRAVEDEKIRDKVSDNEDISGKA